MRVLVVDNDLANGLVARSLLMRDKHDVRIATDGWAALKQTEAFNPDILLLDIVMPGLDGLQLSRRTQQSATLKKQPVRIALTAYNKAANIQTYRQAGIQGLIAKPLRPGNLAEAVAQIQSGGFPMINCHDRTLTELSERPLLDETVIRTGPGMADDVTRERIWRYYRAGLSDSLKHLSHALPGVLSGRLSARAELIAALHALRSASLMVGMDRAPCLAEALRDAPPHQIVERMTDLLLAIRASLPELQAVLLDVNSRSVATRQEAGRVEVRRQH